MAKKGRESLVRSREELALMRESGKITATALKKVIENVYPGRTLAQLEEIAEAEIVRLGGLPSFKTVPGYKWATCLTLNTEIVHGTPRDIKIAAGDILGVDLGTKYCGWHTDAAWSILIGKEKKKREFLKAGEKVLWMALEKAVEGYKVGDISSTIQKGIEGASFAVVKSLAGHGVGRKVHERPEIPGFGKENTGLRLTSGMTLAIEIIYTEKEGDIFEKEDGWTLATLNQSLAGLFEMTVIVGKNKPEVITDWRQIS